ncbi:MAG: tetratricopeptide repeat protein, partial [Rhodospirillales bacterium]
TYLEKALLLDPKNPRLLRRTFVLMIAEGRMKRAFELADKLIAIKKTAPIANLALVSRHIRDKKFSAASNHLSKLKLRGLNAFVVPLLHAWALAGQEKIGEALTALKPLSKNAGAKTLYDLHAGLIHELSGNLEVAEKFYDKVLKSQSGSSLRMAQLLGSFFERQDKPEKALKLYGDFIKRSPNSRLFDSAFARLKSGEKPRAEINTAFDAAAEGLFGIASSLRQQNAEETALVVAQLGLYLKPDFPIMRILIGGIFDSDERYAHAIAVYKKIGIRSPFAWPAQLRIASDLDRLDRTDDAVTMLNDLAARHPKKADMLIDLGDILRSRERFADAVKAYDRALSRIPKIEKKHWSLLYARGISLEQSKQWPRAESDFLKALEFEPEQPYVLNYLGYSWVDRGKNLDKAQNMIKMAVKLRPNDGYIVDSLGWAYYKLGNYKDAVPQLERAVEIRPNDPIINDHLGDVYWRVGRLTEARFQWNRVLILKAQDDLAAKARNKLKRGLVEAAKVKVKGDGL